MTDQGADSGRADLVRSSDGRQETDIQRLDRQWNDLLQELRVVQTGVQLLTGLLLTLPFQPRFDQLAPLARGVYLFTVVTAVTASVLLIAPVAMHRALFRQRARARLVTGGHRLSVCGLGLLGAAMTGVLFLIFGTVAGQTAALIAAGGLLVLFAVLWLLTSARKAPPGVSREHVRP